MKLAINEGYFRKVYGSDRQRSIYDAISICKQGGFHAVDLSLGASESNQNIILSDDYLEEAKKLKLFCDNREVEIVQTHARFDFYQLTRERFIDDMIKSVRVSKELGATNVVVHADTYYDPEYRFDFDTVLKIIYDIYAPMVEEAKKLDIQIAMETLFEDRAPQGKRARFTSMIEELDAIVSMYHDPIVGICWDFGHARVTYGDEQFEKMKLVGNKIISTHVHDNFWEQDLHSMPFLGKTDWEMAMKTMKEIGYRGAWTLELVYGCLPEPLVVDFAKLCHRVGSYMINSFSTK